MEQATFPRYDQYKSTDVKWLGDIPEHWSIGKIRAVTVLKSKKNQPDLPVLSVYRDYGVILKDSRDDNHNATSLDTSNYKVVDVGDLVVNKMKAWQGSMGISQYHGIVSPAYITCTVETERVFPKFLHYLLRSQPYIGVYNALSYGVRVGQWDMHYEDFKHIPLPIPSREEQQRIGNFLDQKTAEIDEAIAKKQRLIELLKEQKAILINQAVTKGLNPDAPMRDSGVEWIGKVPEHWSTSRIGFVAEVGNGSTPNRGTPGYWYNGDIPWLNSSKVNDGVITEADQFVTKRAMKECHLPTVSPGSIVVAITGEGKTRGMAALCQLNATINQHLAYIRIRDERLVPEYLVLYLQGMYDWLRYESSSNGSTKGAITCSDIKKYMLPLPPVQEQQEIVIHVERWTREWADLMEKTGTGILQLEEFKTVIVAQAVTGKIKL